MKGNRILERFGGEETGISSDMERVMSMVERNCDLLGCPVITPDVLFLSIMDVYEGLDLILVNPTEGEENSPEGVAFEIPEGLRGSEFQLTYLEIAAHVQLMSGRFRRKKKELKKAPSSRERKIPEDLYPFIDIVVAQRDFGRNPSVNKDEWWLDRTSGPKRRKRGASLVPPPFSSSLTEESRGMDPIVGREDVIERVLVILGRYRKNNPLLVGEPGVGKTALLYGVAQKISAGAVPSGLRGRDLLLLDFARLLAGTQYRGDFETRMLQLLDGVKVSRSILAIDEIHSVMNGGVGADGSPDASSMLKPPLSSGEIQCIGVTTATEYKEKFEKDPAFARRFQTVEVGEPSVEEAIDILFGARPSYEVHHKVEYSSEAITAAVELSSRYITAQFLPDKAFDMIDEAGSYATMEQSPRELSLNEAIRKLTSLRNREKRSSERYRRLDDSLLLVKFRYRALLLVNESSEEIKSVGEGEIAKVVSGIAKVPAAKLTSSELDKLQGLEEILSGKVIGQERAVRAVANAVKRSKVGLRNPTKPAASFLFSGPTGVGKTELCKVLSDYVFDGPVERFDMSEYMSAADVSKLLGSAPGYVGYGEGGALTEAVRGRPYCLLLFDEIEKAHPLIFDIMLQLLDDGRLTDSRGRLVEFKNTIVILTSNIGSQSVSEASSSVGGSADFFDERDLLEGNSGNEDTSRYESLKSIVFGELSGFFRPEFLNRLDEIVVFRSLDREDVRSICDIAIGSFTRRALDSQGIEVEVTKPLREMVLSQGYDPALGARPLNRAVTSLLEDSLSESMVGGRLCSGDKSIMDLGMDGKPIVRLFLENVPPRPW
jgi:ATP-dependent Clp protease ATP-binding subunit ClpC